jgi:hypothetical protein
MNVIVHEKPILCESELTVFIGKVMYVFPPFCLVSGGDCYFNEFYSIVTDKGPWSINNWPKDFPEERKAEVLKELNEILPWGCCGGCVDENSV